jgi:hypothetical protein
LLPEKLPEHVDDRSPSAQPEAREHNKQAQEPALNLHQGLDLLANRASAWELPKRAGKRLPGEP